MLKKKKKIDSHVQNSRTIIKNFRKSDEDGNTYALNLKTWEIDDKKGPSKIGVIYGYYDSNTEEFLSSKYETPIGNIVKKLQGWEAQNTVSSLTASEITDIGRFLTMLMAREPSMIDQAVAKTVIAKELGLKPTPSNFVHMLEKTDLVNTFFDLHYPVVVFNKTDKKFISSIKGFCAWKSVNETANWWFPVTPTIAIHYVGADVFKDLYKKSSAAVLTDEKSIEGYNDMMMRAAIRENNVYVFSNTDTELIRLKGAFESKEDK